MVDFITVLDLNRISTYPNSFIIHTKTYLKDDAIIMLSDTNRLRDKIKIIVESIGIRTENNYIINGIEKYKR